MELYQCRYCLEDDNLENLVSPCQCNGTSKYIHAKCLDTWRNQNIQNEHFKKCIDCQTEYQFKYLNEKETLIISLKNFRHLYITMFMVFSLFNVTFDTNNIYNYKLHNNSSIITDENLEVLNIILSSNFITYTSFYISFFIVLLFIKNRMLYGKKMYNYNLIALLNISQIFIFFLNVYTFCALGIMYIFFNFFILHTYVENHNKKLTEINNLNMEYAVVDEIEA